MGGPPWIDPQRQHGIAPHAGDVWVSVPIKSGTNWMMNIVHQLLTGGDGEFESIYEEVPWPELVERPGQDASRLHARLEAAPPGRRRAFKSHTPPPALPYFEPSSGPDVKYVVVCRNPEEAMVSAKIFLEMHTDEFYELWDVPRAALTRPTFDAFYHEVIDAGEMQGMIFGFLAQWWSLRDAPNVQLLHFTDLKRDLPAGLRKVASFLGVEPTPAQWAAIDEHASFDWMKRHESKFETIPHVAVQPLKTGAMVRKGKVGVAHEDGMTPEISKHLREVGSRILTDENAMRWLYEGGSLP